MAKQVTVIGGGIIGASIAWHLTVAGARVRLVSETPGGVATPNSFAWINASWGNPLDYFRLRTCSMREWTRLADAVPDIPLSWQGSICWDMTDDRLLAYLDQHTAWGYDIRRIDSAEIATLEPALEAVPSFALNVREEGVAEPLAATHALIADARRRGLDLIEGIHVTSLRKRPGSMDIVLADGETLQAEHVVLAAGAGTAALAATIGIEVPLETPPGLLVHTKPVPPMLNGLLLAPELHLRQTTEGRLVAGTDFGGMDPGAEPQRAAQELFAKMQRFVKGGAELEMDFFTVGYRPTPRDGFPIVGNVPGIDGLYLAVTHSGITLAPALGAFAAAEILEGTEEPLLAPYRLSRFSQSESSAPTQI
ncbi:FAD-binding oxidoreductase [Neorhizobium lilium]|uniref:FAD-binding oxidoreductase n=1 Tax=Neorhizobium lilium TaxID=2503024 RepID=A0A444LJL0_9HYPH|nr:FAD-binding oxidoreductase [Neorhizobium lilium]RWX79114.1 FAD-binding oxidoreductase [Neorhizobium lilium]